MCGGQSQLAEILFYMIIDVGTIRRAIAMASFYRPPNIQLYEQSYKTYISVPHLRDTGVHVIDVKDINSVIAMVPDTSYRLSHQDGTKNNRWFLMEKPGLKMSTMVDIDELTPK